jgi:hypothetical protein
MGDMIDMYRGLKEVKREMRTALGVGCPMCRVKQPKRTPTVLLPQQRCKVDGYRDPRPEVVIDEWFSSRATPPSTEGASNG